MPDDHDQGESHPTTPTSSTSSQTSNKRPRAESESESTDSLVVSSRPIFVLEDNDASTDEEETSGSEDSMSVSARMEVEEWIKAGEEGNGREDREDTPRASKLAGVEDGVEEGESEGDETVLLESPAQGRRAKVDDDEGTPRAYSKWKDVKDGNDILADPFAGENYSKSGYKPLPGLFGETIHYGAKRRLVKAGDLSRSYVFPDSVHQDTDMTGASVTYSESNTERNAREEDDTPKYHTVDNTWMESLLSLPWVSKDMSMIFDTGTRKLVPMPRRRLERKKLFIDLHSLLMKGVLFVQLDAVGDWMKETIPAELWWDVFTEKESEDLQEATHRKLYFDMITRAITVVEEWRLRYQYPKVPESAEEVLNARMETKQQHELKSHILATAPAKTVDRWVKYVFQGVMEPGNMNKVLASELEGIRQRVISKLVHVTELPFASCWTVEDFLKVPLYNKRKMESIIDEQLNGLFQNLTIRDE
ncbi:hypothetical protein ONS95_010681 [Cadophora gregata]|uniref:uncharacterized protein n=1 Tax=Cadophora gregata TaxID=51156 RepID=UPI0026DDADFD|nr:uncharacterized protein ONS95_010681 [Cadophora gregata]KAK0122448.1 hypothetical protein ONS95_010681 [Cadophora gregata]